MKFLVLILCIANTTSFANSKDLKLAPKLMEALSSYVNDPEGYLPLAPELMQIRNLIQEKNIDPDFLNKKLDQYHPSLITKRISKSSDFKHDSKAKPMAIAFEINKISVIEDSDDWFDDDIYAYFFITDGFTTTAKITDTYKNVDEGEAFFLNLKDRKLFPNLANQAKALTNHLIVDMGIVESDGDDIEEAKKITSVILDLAIIIVASQNPDVGREIARHRKELKALADFFNDLNKDDRLVTDSIIFNAKDLNKMLPEDTTLYQFNKNYKGKDRWSEWEYQVDFRLLK